MDVRKLGLEAVEPLPPAVAGEVASAHGVGAWVKEVLRGAPKISLTILTLAVLCALFAPWLAPADPIVGNLADSLQPPGSAGHLLGTDNQGRDLLSRIIYGARISVTVGVLAVFVAGGVGTIMAVLSGVYKGWVDVVLMRLTDAFLALPFLMIAVTVVSLLGPSLLNVILVIGLLRWMGYARVLRGEVLRLMEMDFVRLALVAGASRWRIILRHILPNLVNTLLVLGTLELGVAVIAEAGLSFLGLGVPRPLPSWGTMLAESQQYFYIAWWLPVIPGVAITLLVMASNLTGDWLRDRTDPTRRQL
ncbi:MAG TPA: ABC transporter permease [Alphaproteobacteria bacterium]|nr:ABC transporter permease [Alphaproteobacteria bacterium]